MKKVPLLALALVFLVVAGGPALRTKLNDALFPGTTASQASTAGGKSILEDAFRQGRSGFMAELEAPVIRILPDDNEGSRHQRFLVKLASGQTILIVHNIDLAPRVAGLEVGERISAHGEYIWNEKGGLLHKTHINRGNAPDGWILHEGRLYQ